MCEIPTIFGSFDANYIGTGEQKHKFGEAVAFINPSRPISSMSSRSDVGLYQMATNKPKDLKRVSCAFANAKRRNGAVK